MRLLKLFKYIAPLLLLLPFTAQAVTTVPWSITNLTDTFIFPNSVNGSAKGILVSASSTVNGNFSVSTLTSGNCVQASTGGLLVNASGACGSTFSTTSLSAVAPLQYSQSPLAQFSITQAGTGGNGYLSSTDFNTFNNKISSTSLSVTTTGTSGAATYTPSTGVFNIPQYQAGGNYITALTGDVTATGPGSVAATLATVNGNVGTFTYPSITVNGKGLITAISNGTAPTTYTGTFPIVVTGSVISSLFSTTSNSGMSAGNLYVGTSGIFQTSGTSTPTVSAPITYSGTLGQFISGVSGAFGCTTASAGVTGCLSGTDYSTFNNKQASGFQITTTTPLSIGNLAYLTGVTPTSLGAVATTTASCSGTASCSAFTVIGSSPVTITGTGGTVTSVTATYPILSTGGTAPIISTAFGTTTNNGIAQGNLYVGTGGIFQSSATGTVTNGTGISVTSGQSVIGSGLTITNTGVTSLGNGTGTTCTGTAPGTCNVNTTQNITTLSNLGTGTVNVNAGVLYNTATSTITAGSGIAYTGTMGSEIGGVSGTLSVSGLTTSNFTSANVSQFTNDAGYLTSSTGVTSVKQTYGTAQSGALTFATTSASFNGLTVADAITNSTGTFTITPLWSGTLNNAGLTNSSVTVNTGTGLSGGGAVSLGGTALSLANTGVISNSCSSGISCSGTNPSAFTNTGVTSIVAGTNITVSGATGAVTINSTGGGSSFGYPFTNPTEFGTTTAATTTPIWAQEGIFASSTSYIASTTFSVNGNVGIGSTSPTSKLTLIQDNTSTLFTAFTIDGVTAGAGAEMALNRGSNTGNEEANIDFNTNGAELWQLGMQNNSSNDFELWDGSDDPVFTIKTGTNAVGFGTTTPFGDFAINADFGDPSGLIFNVASSSQSATTSVFAINSNGYVMIGTTTPTVGTATFAEVISNSIRSLGGLAINTWTNVTNAFTINNAAGTTVFNVDTTAANPFLGVGTTTPWATASVVGDGTDPVFAVSTSTSGNVLPNFEIDQNGHLITSGLKPTCTTSCTFGQGNDNAFRVTSGTAVTSEVVTFAKSWGTFAPICQATEGNNTAVPILVAASSTPTTVTLTNAALTTRDIDVICEGIQ